MFENENRMVCGEAKRGEARRVFIFAMFFALFIIEFCPNTEKLFDSSFLWLEAKRKSKQPNKNHKVRAFGLFVLLIVKPKTTIKSSRNLIYGILHATMWTRNEKREYTNNNSVCLVSEWCSANTHYTCISVKQSYICFLQPTLLDPSPSPSIDVYICTNVRPQVHICISNISQTMVHGPWTMLMLCTHIYAYISKISSTVDGRRQPVIQNEQFIVFL